MKNPQCKRTGLGKMDARIAVGRTFGVAGVPPLFSGPFRR
jgi:hypothetical protein